MKIRTYIALTTAVMQIILVGTVMSEGPVVEDLPTLVPLPQIEPDTALLYDALRLRRSTRAYGESPPSIRDVARILWAAQGQGEGRHRTIPSAGALYPLEFYLVAGLVAGVPTAVYHYNMAPPQLKLHQGQDVREEVAAAALNQKWISRAPALVVIAAAPQRTTKRYGSRGMRYVYMEAGHAAQNIYLQAAALNMGVAEVGAFNDKALSTALDLPSEIEPLLILAIGNF